MREETRRKLERQLWMQRLKWIGAGLAVATVHGRSASGTPASMHRWRRGMWRAW